MKNRMSLKEYIIGGSVFFIGFLISSFFYEDLLSFNSGESLSSRSGKLLFRYLDEVGGKMGLRVFFFVMTLYAFAKAATIIKKQKKLHDSINSGTLLKEHSVINFDNKLLEVLDLSWEGKKYRGYGRIYSKGEEENWKPVEFSSLTLTNDGTSKLSGQFKYLTDNEWEAKGEDVNELPWNKLKQKEAELNTWNSAEGKCPACGAIINDDDSSCPECGLNFNSDASN